MIFGNFTPFKRQYHRQNTVAATATDSADDDSNAEDDHSSLLPHYHASYSKS